jgi:hypothetical protein
MHGQRPAWVSVAIGIVIGLSLATALMGGVYGWYLLNREGPVPPSTSTPAASGAIGSAATPAASVGGSAPPSAPSSASQPQSSASGPAAAVIDPALLAVLPTTVGGIPVHEFPEAEQQAVGDPDLGRNVSRVATAFVGDQAGTNWAYTAIVDVRPAARSDAFYRSWQESFDASACERAGGVTGHTSTVIAGRNVERTACGGGVRTYHVRIDGTGLLVSISDVGDAKFGEQEIAALHP